MAESSVGSSASATLSDPDRLKAGLQRGAPKKSSKIWLPGASLCQPDCVQLFKIRRSCARSQGGCALFQCGCDGVRSSLEGTDKSCAHAAKDLSNQEETTRMGQAGPVSSGRVFVSPRELQGFFASWVVRRDVHKRGTRKAVSSSGLGGGYQALSAPRV